MTLRKHQFRSRNLQQILRQQSRAMIRLVNVTGIGLMCLLVTSAAQAGNAKTYDPVSQDPVVIDKSHPPLVHEVTFNSGGITLYGKVFSAQGATAHPTVLIARGYPDMTSSVDIVLTLQRAGYNAMIFNYRGTWGMGGAFSIENSYQDLRAAVAFLRNYQTSRNMLVDPGNIILYGYSLGGPVALRLAASDPQIRGVLQLDGTDLRAMPKLNPDQKAEWAGGLTTPAIPEANGTRIIDDVIAQFDDWNPENYASGLAGKDVFLLWASHGNGAEVRNAGRTLHDLYAAQARVTERTFDTNHDFSDHRVDLARATLAWMEKVRLAPVSFVQKSAQDEHNEITLPQEQLLKYVGVYQDTNGLPLYMKEEDGRLLKGNVDRAWSSVIALDNKKFAVTDDTGRHCDDLSFNEDSAGTVTSLTLYCSGRPVILKRTSAELNFPSEPEIVSVSPEVLKGYVGKYRLPLKFQPSSYFDVALKGGQLIVTPEGDAGFLLFPESSNKFFGRTVKGEVEFVRDESGAISHIHAKLKDGEFDFPREQ